LLSPFGVAVDASGNVYIADTFNNRIRLVTKSTGIITTVAGDGKPSYGGDDGKAISARLNLPFGVAIDVSGNVYIADGSNNRIRLVTKSTGFITTVAGVGTRGYAGDEGQAISARLGSPTGVAIDASGNIYIADALNNVIRLVTKSTGIITTVAGNGTEAYGGDGGPAISAQLKFPKGVAIDTSGNIYIADTVNHRIRLVTKSTGIITTVAGDGTPSYGGDEGQAISAQLNQPYGVTVDASGNVYIADNSNNVIRLVTKSTGFITTVAGTGAFGYAGNGGLATSAELWTPRGVALDSSGLLYIADTVNHRIRTVGPPQESSAPTAPPSSSRPTAWPTASPVSCRTVSPTKSCKSISPTAWLSKMPLTVKPSKRPVKCKTSKPTRCL
jgi:trimeric autotransporter adhesin